jgi:alpha-tubulin suppressor-like RCC1 family protein
MNARWSRRMARAAGSVVLTLGLAAGAAATSGAASAAVTAPARGCCHILTQSAAAAWGFNASGELGNGTGNIYLDVNPNWNAVMGLSSGVAAVSAGYSYALALTSDGSVWAWGSNGSGQLGDGATTGSDVPVQVTGLTGIVAVSAGNSESVALRSDGTVWTWGGNTGGDLGNGTTTASSTPVQVTGLTGVTQISAGQSFVLALRSDGTVWAWGANDYGQLGDGTTFDSSVPVQVTGLSRVTAIAAGGEDSMAVETKGYVNMLSAVYEWGANEHGQIGDGTYRERPVPVQINGIGAQHVSGIAAGLNFSMVLGSDGSVWDWGVNQIGQLGDGSTANAIVPVEAQGPGSGITQISAGYYHVLALRSDGTVEAWGDNFCGELGNGTNDPAVPNPTPVQVVGLGSVTAVSAGYLFSLAIHQIAFIQLPGVTRRTATALTTS